MNCQFMTSSGEGSVAWTVKQEVSGSRSAVRLCKNGALFFTEKTVEREVCPSTCNTLDTMNT